jgi:hypothetical protein
MVTDPQHCFDYFSTKCIKKISPVRQIFLKKCDLLALVKMLVSHIFKNRERKIDFKNGWHEKNEHH